MNTRPIQLTDAAIDYLRTLLQRQPLEDSMHLWHDIEAQRQAQLAQHATAMRAAIKEEVRAELLAETDAASNKGPKK